MGSSKALDRATQDSAAWCERFVTRTPDVQGGATVLAGTRTPVGSVVALYRMYNEDMAEIRSAYPHLTDTQIRAALAYYERHRQKIDEEEARNEQTFEVSISGR